MWPDGGAPVAPSPVPPSIVRRAPTDPSTRRAPLRRDPGDMAGGGRRNRAVEQALQARMTVNSLATWAQLACSPYGSRAGAMSSTARPKSCAPAEEQGRQSADDAAACRDRGALELRRADARPCALRERPMSICRCHVKTSSTGER